MKTNLLPFARIARNRAAYNHGKWRARSYAGLHINASCRDIIRNAVHALCHSEKAMRKNMAHAARIDRRALYLGMFSALRQERRLMRAFAL
jgi:hypothetical protein